MYRQLMIALMVSSLALLAGCGEEQNAQSTADVPAAAGDVASANDVESISAGTVELMNGVADALESAQDLESANAAADTIGQLTEQMHVLSENFRNLEGDNQQLMSQLQDLVGDGLDDALERIAITRNELDAAVAVIVAEPVARFLDALDSLQVSEE